MVFVLVGGVLSKIKKPVAVAEPALDRFNFKGCETFTSRPIVCVGSIVPCKSKLAVIPKDFVSSSPIPKSGTVWEEGEVALVEENEMGVPVGKTFLYILFISAL